MAGWYTEFLQSAVAFIAVAVAGDTDSVGFFNYGVLTGSDDRYMD